ncbi:MAG: hypothetical protein NVSMB51_19090 [Solirubrobacteraceae bacterium]
MSHRPHHPGARTRLLETARTLGPEERLAGMAAIALWISMLLPWYVDTVVRTGPLTSTTRESLTAFGAFSFVEAAVLLVSAGVLWMLFARAERRAFHLPGGDGLVITLAGLWAAVLIFYRMLDTPNASVKSAMIVTDVGLKWGIFLALAAAGMLAYAGTRLRAAHRPEPDLASDPTVRHTVVQRPPPPAASTAPLRRPADEDETQQLTFEDPFGETRR